MDFCWTVIGSQTLFFPLFPWTKNYSFNLISNKLFACHTTFAEKFPAFDKGLLPILYASVAIPADFRLEA